MAKLNELFKSRFGKKEKKQPEPSSSKEVALIPAFAPPEVSEDDREELQVLLDKYAPEEESSSAEDLENLASITSEVRAINNQAAILHGERIKRAQGILKRYKEGAFTAWLLATYGNRQTPYNFLQYFEFYRTMPKELHHKIDSMPRQAVYTLASRKGEIETKEEIVRNYEGETKQELISHIRTTFPLAENDKRRENPGEGAISQMRRILNSIESPDLKLTPKQHQSLTELIHEIESRISTCEIKDQ